MHNRTVICLEVRGEVEREQATEELYEALDRLSATMPATAKATIGEGCEVNLPDSGLDRFQNIGPGIVEAPGPWLTVVVVLGDTMADQLLGTENVNYASYEMMVSGQHDAGEVTSALVVRQGHLQDETFLDYLAMPMTFLR